ncbi:hypothetical protein VTG60DRAFT_4499 [Thermothelomyces hinnuleus]
MVSLRSLVAGAVIFAAPVLAALSPLQITSGLRQLALKSTNLNPAAQRIHGFNAGLMIIGQGPISELIKGINDINSTATTLNKQLEGMSPIQAPVEADQFVNAQLVLLSTLTSKAVAIGKNQFVDKPVAAALRGEKIPIMSIALKLPILVQSRAAAIQPVNDALIDTLDRCIAVYEGVGA